MRNLYYEKANKVTLNSFFDYLLGKNDDWKVISYSYEEDIKKETYKPKINIFENKNVYNIEYPQIRIEYIKVIYKDINYDVVTLIENRFIVPYISYTPSDRLTDVVDKEIDDKIKELFVEKNMLFLFMDKDNVKITFETLEDIFKQISVLFTSKEKIDNLTEFVNKYIKERDDVK